MATPQQPAQQPVYPRDLSVALDRTYAKFTVYTDARVEQLAAQMRIGFEDTLIRDNDLATSVRALADSMLRLSERMSKVENTQQDIINKLDVMQEQIKDGFAAQAERLNEVIVRVEKLERNGQN